MPMRYADQATVLSLLRLTGDDTDAVTHLVALENGLAATFDGLTGRTFGTSATPEARTVAAYASDVLPLTDGVRTVSGVAVDGAWDGGLWADETVLGPADYRLWPVDRDGVAYGLLRTDGSLWSGAVRVTALWADQADGTVPPDVVLTLTTLTVKEYRRQTSSPSEQVGPDGQIVSTPSGWNDPGVKAVVARHTLVRLVV